MTNRFKRVAYSSTILAILALNQASANEATIVALYQDCKFVTSTVVVQSPALAGAAREAELSATNVEFDAAIGPMIAVLKRHGVTTIDVERRGYAGCAPPNTGKFVEAVADYCGERLLSAEIKVDRNVFKRLDSPAVSFEEFVANAVQELRRSGIWDSPRIVVNSDSECVEADAR